MGGWHEDAGIEIVEANTYDAPEVAGIDPASLVTLLATLALQSASASASTEILQFPLLTLSND